MYVRESHVEKMGKIQDVAYEILNVLEFNRSFFLARVQQVYKTVKCFFISSLPCFIHPFEIYTMHNSTRKRQSVVCRYPDGRLVLYCKVIAL